MARSASSATSTRRVGQQQAPDFSGVGQLGRGFEPPISVALDGAAETFEGPQQTLCQPARSGGDQFPVDELANRKRLAGCGQLAHNREPRGADQGFYQRALLAALGSGGAPGGKPRQNHASVVENRGRGVFGQRRRNQIDVEQALGGTAAAKLDLAEPAILQRRDDFAGVVIELNIRRRRSDPDPRQL